MTASVSHCCDLKQDVQGAIEVSRQCLSHACALNVGLPVHRYEKPTAIQAQALPAALSGRDVLVRLSPAYLYSHHFAYQLPFRTQL